jgi:signal transduction histidine kinase
MNIYSFIILIGVIIISLVTGFLVAIIWQQKRIFQLQKAKTSAEIRTIENERKRIASDLHDEVGPLLSCIKLIYNSVEVAKEDKAVMQRGNQLINDIIMTIRGICNNLMPSILLRRGIIPALKEIISDFSEKSYVRIDFTYDPIPEFSEEKSINLYRIILEIIHNTLKHSDATTLSISLKITNQFLVLTTIDDGKGFDFSKVKKGESGSGLLNLASRTEMMDGQTQIESKPHKGTKFIIQIPLNSN